MKRKISVEKLLRWRFNKARAEAPPAPCPARLLAFARPWWEASPEQFQSAIRRLRSIEIARVRPVSKPLQSPTRSRVPALIVRIEEEIETSVRMLSMGLSEGRLQLSFQCETAVEPDEQMLEATFVSEATWKPLFCALAVKSSDDEYRLRAKLSHDVAKECGQLIVTDRISFRLILRSMANPV